MIAGVVEALEARIDLFVYDSEEQVHSIRGIIDTGYNGYLTLPLENVNALNLPSIGQRKAELADGSLVLLEAFLAKIRWDDQQRYITITHSEGGNLVGMELLNGYRLQIDVVERGQVRIEKTSR